MKTKYALMALTTLAESHDRATMQIAELASEKNIPRKFLEAILLALKNQGILASRKGPGGGYSLAVAPTSLTIGTVVRVFEGSLAPVKCLSDAAPARCDECDDLKTCGIRLVMADVKSAVSSILDHTTLADMIERSSIERQKNLNVQNYII